MYGFPLQDLGRDQRFRPDLSSGMSGEYQASFEGMGLSLVNTVPAFSKPGVFVKPKLSTPSGSTLSQILNTPPVTPMKICNKDLKMCPDGSKVGRDPLKNCAFKDCPPSSVCLPPSAPTKCPNGSMPQWDYTNCKWTDCIASQNPNQYYIDEFKKAFGQEPTSAQLTNFISLWNTLGRIPTAEEFNCYVTTGNPVCGGTTPGGGGGNGGGGGGGGAPEEPVKEPTAETVPTKDKKWLLYAGIAAAAIGIGGLLFGGSKTVVKS